MDETVEKAQKYVDMLLQEGASVPCDNTVDSFNKSDELPPFYDQELFKKGQAFYHKHIFGVFSGKLFGLISILAIPSILKILKYTKMSSSDMTAYRRYSATILHMIIWYDSDFKPGSKLWRSISEIKHFHNSASNKGCTAGLHRISQKDMALTQFGFMGYQLIRSDLLGIYYATEDEWKAFIHFWRVIGHVLGIEERFNMCKESVEETRLICEKFVQQVFKPAVSKKDPEFLEMTRYLINGLWAVQPILNFNVVMTSLNIFLNNNTNLKNNEEYKKLTFWEKCIFFVIGLVFISLKWAPFRWYHNHTKYRDIWLMKHFPFLGYYKFGFKKGTVTIMGKND